MPEIRGALDQVLGIVEPDILPDRLQLTAHTARGSGAVADTRDNAGDHGRKSEGTGDKENGSRAATGIPGHFVSDEKTETEAGGGLRETDCPADGKVLRKFVE
jgi:hypothetical protein